MSSNHLNSWFYIFEDFLKKYHDLISNKLNNPKLKKIFIMGSTDRIWLPKMKSELKKGKNVDLIILEKSSHLCNLDNIEYFNKIIRCFLETYNVRLFVKS